MDDYINKITDQELMNDFKVLINIPQTRRILFHKIEELKLQYKQNVNNVKAIKGMADNSLKKRESRTFEFSIEFYDQQWHPTLADCRNHNPFTFIEMEVFKYIQNKAELHLIQMEKGLNFPGNKRLFDLAYEKIDDGLIMGKITVNYPEESALLDVNISTEETNAFNLLLHHMIESPTIKKHIFDELIFKCIPLLESEPVLTAT